MLTTDLRALKRLSLQNKHDCTTDIMAPIPLQRVNHAGEW